MRTPGFAFMAAGKDTCYRGLTLASPRAISTGSSVETAHCSSQFVQ
jgi:hypothetical protein